MEISITVRLSVHKGAVHLRHFCGTDDTEQLFGVPHPRDLSPASCQQIVEELAPWVLRRFEKEANAAMVAARDAIDGIVRTEEREV